MEKVRPSATLDSLILALQRGDIKIKVTKTAITFSEKKKRYVMPLF